MIKEQTACFTGHRIIAPNEKQEIYCRLKDTIIDLIKKGYKYFGTGGALGFDTLAEQAIIELRDKYPEIKLILVLPCVSQSERWRDCDKKLYENIKAKANKIVYTSRAYYRGCMQKRNRHLINYSSVCVCYLLRKTGGTAYTVKYAENKGLRIINIA